MSQVRTELALDRTTLAWVRTALSFASFGFGMVAFFRATAQATQSEPAVRLHQAAIRFEVALLVMGMVATILAAFSHGMALRSLHRGEDLSVARWPVAIAMAVLTSVLGLHALWSVIAL